MLIINQDRFYTLKSEEVQDWALKHADAPNGRNWGLYAKHLNHMGQEVCTPMGYYHTKAKALKERDALLKAMESNMSIYHIRKDSEVK